MSGQLRAWHWLGAVPELFVTHIRDESRGFPSIQVRVHLSDD